MGDLSDAGKEREKPVHEVRIGYNFAVGKYEVTRGEFATFVTETNRDVDKYCYASESSQWENQTDETMRDPGSSPPDRDPAACINWNDAQAYVDWMSRKTGEQYRLLSESEWEYMARAGSPSKYPFGSSENTLCEHGNGADQSTSLFWRNNSCSDGSGEGPVQVGSYKANKFGVYDTVGNVWEWVADCWHENYNNAPNGGSTWMSGGDCSRRLLRGGSWNSQPRVLRSSNRDWDRSKDRDKDNGFRIARTLSR